MRVLLIDVTCKTGSTGQIVYNLYEFLNSNNEEAAVCYGRGKEIKEHNILKFGYDWETYLHAFMTRITGYTGCFSYFSTRRLLRFIDEFKPDIVHIHELHAYFVNIKPLLRYLADKKIIVVHTLHCEFSYTGKCGHSVECVKWKTECGDCPRLKEYPVSLLFDHTKRMYQIKKAAFSAIKDLSIITPSKWLSDRVKHSFLGNRNITVINNGINTSVFKPVDSTDLRKELGISPAEKVILALAPNLMSEAKGGQYVIKIANDLKNQGFKFVLVGVDNPDNYKYDGIIIKGRVYEKTLLAKYYSMADLFVICSERENFPTTCLEAQACGTPVCGFNTGGTVETLIDNNVSGFVPYGEVDQLKEIILNTQKKDSDTIKRLSTKTRERFSTEASCRKHIEYYKEQMLCKNRNDNNGR